jgi:T4 RnlA family RNA ligase
MNSEKHHTFPVITNISQLMHVVEQKKEILKLHDEQLGIDIISYIISCDTTFDTPHAKECRGITFDQKGNVISRPFEKFFNLNEREETMFSKLKDKKILRIMPKLDGSMITGFVLDDKVVLKSKKKAEADVAKLARRFMTPDHERLIRNLSELGYTPIFEFIGPLNRIVLQHKENKLVLLAIRENESGQYIDVNEYCSNNYPNVEVIQDFQDVVGRQFDTLKELADYVQNESTTDIEGCVVQFDDHTHVKIKTFWYMNLHHNLTFMRVRDIAELCATEQVDDYIALLEAQNADPELIRRTHDIESRVTEEIKAIESTFDLLCSKLANIQNEFQDRQKTYTAAIHLCNEYQFKDVKHLLRTVADGNDGSFDVIKYFMRFVLKEKFDLSNVAATITNDRVKYDADNIWQEG